MPQIISLALLETHGINLDTCEVTVTAARTGDDIIVTVLPKMVPFYEQKLVDFVRQFVASDMRDGVTYSLTMNRYGLDSIVFRADGTVVEERGDEVGRIRSSLSQMTAFGVEALAGVVGFLRSAAGLSSVLEIASLSSLQTAVEDGRADLLAPGARKAVCICGACGRDRRGEFLGQGNVGFMTSKPLSCGNPYFEIGAELLEEAADRLVAVLELPQLRRLALELREEGSDLAVTLPEGDAGEPVTGTVLHADLSVHATHAVPRSELDKLFDEAPGGDIVYDA